MRERLERVAKSIVDAAKIAGLMDQLGLQVSFTACGNWIDDADEIAFFGAVGKPIAELQGTFVNLQCDGEMGSFTMDEEDDDCCILVRGIN